LLPQVLESRLRTQIGWDRVRSATPAYVNERIDRRIEGEMRHLAEAERELLKQQLAATGPGERA